MLPDQKAQQTACQIPDSNIPAADIKAQDQPCRKQDHAYDHLIANREVTVPWVEYIQDRTQ